MYSKWVQATKRQNKQLNYHKQNINTYLLFSPARHH